MTLMAKFRVAMMTTCTHNGLIIHYKAQILQMCIASGSNMYQVSTADLKPGQEPAYHAFTVTHILSFGALKIYLLCSIFCSRTGIVVKLFAFYMQFCMSNSLHVADNFIKTESVLMKGIKVHITLCSIIQCLLYQNI